MNLTMTELPVEDLNQQPTSLTAVRKDKAMAIYFTTVDKLTTGGDLSIFLKIFEEKKNYINFALVVMKAEEGTKEKVEKLLAENKAATPVYTSKEDQNSLAKFGIMGLPARLVVNKERKIKGLISGDGQLSENDLREIIEPVIE